MVSQMNYEMDSIHNSLLENHFNACEFVLNDDSLVLNESTLDKEGFRHLIKLSKEAIIKMVEKIKEFIMNILNLIKDQTSSGKIKKIKENESFIKSVDLSNFKRESYSNLNKWINIYPNAGLMRIRNIVTESINVYEKEISKFRATSEFVLKTGTNPFNMLKIDKIREKLLKDITTTQVDSKHLFEISGVRDIMGKVILGDTVTLTKNTINANNLIINMNKIPEEIEKINQIIPKITELREQFDRTISKLPSNKSIVVINSYINTSISEFITILRMVINLLFTKYNSSVNILIGILKHGKTNK